MKISFAALTDVGLVRENNEDTFLVMDLSTGRRLTPPPPSGEGTLETEGRGVLLAVADGMGGALAGEVASRMAVEALVDIVRDPGEAGTDPGDRVVAAIRLANRRIHESSQVNAEQRGMGTTLTAALIRAERIQFFQVGDSKGFLAREGRLDQMTKDHSLIGRLVDDKVITPEDAEHLEGGKNIILQALGAEPAVKVDRSEAELGEGQSVVLCTDGLHGCVKRQELEERILRATDAAKLSEDLVAAAHERGAPDNVTVISVAVLEGGSERPAQGLLERLGSLWKRK